MDEESPKNLARWLRKVFHRLAGLGDPAEIEKEIEELITEGEKQGIISEDEGEMIQGIFSFRDTTAREIMVPRTDVTAVPAGTSLEEVVKVIVESGHSRIPVYENTLDNIIGIIHAKDLLRYWGQTDTEARSLVRAPYFIPETKKISAVLAELRNKKSHLAIVVDEYGGTAGILTLEDIIEEIIGDIMDEYDSDEHWITENDDGSLIVDARLDVEDLEEYLNVSFPEGKFESVGGLIFSLIGRVPQKGEVIQWGDLEMEILAATDRKVEKVLIRRSTEGASDNASQSGVVI
ncbi:hemolysin family protein [Thermodesulforhabdus norvegica]|uniref:hemolysin family protein n=1 Tax=Thermodesulforhabdus norvegica TaxID=39841 RepID=UPI000B889EA9|nr:hemolysin family protein [Thermodesulforhabdus norvegica]